MMHFGLAHLTGLAENAMLITTHCIQEENAIMDLTVQALDRTRKAVLKLIANDKADDVHTARGWQKQIVQEATDIRRVMFAASVKATEVMELFDEAKERARAFLKRKTEDRERKQLIAGVADQAATKGSIRMWAFEVMKEITLSRAEEAGLKQELFAFNPVSYLDAQNPRLHVAHLCVESGRLSRG